MLRVIFSIYCIYIVIDVMLCYWLLQLSHRTSKDDLGRIRYFLLGLNIFQKTKCSWTFVAFLGDLICETVLDVM